MTDRRGQGTFRKQAEVNVDEGIDISGLDKVAVLIALYGRARPQGMGMLHYVPGPLSVEEAKAYIADGYGLRPDYLKGRVMKVDIRRDTLDPWGFDRDNGTGAAAGALAPLLAKRDAEKA